MSDFADKIDWAKSDGLVPAVIQDSATARVLMLGYMTREALAQTLESGHVTFFSRSRNRLWMKGESSGNVLTLVSAAVDCDGDTLLIQAMPAGPTCHTGDETCFGAPPADLGFLGRLGQIIDERAVAPSEESYVAGLLKRGVAKMAQKVGEEGVETALAAVLQSEDDFRNEAADLIFHLMVLLRGKNLTLATIAAVLEQRHRRPA